MSTSVSRRAGPYVLERRLGRGATGEVWVGRNVQSSALVAVKVLRPGEGGNLGRFLIDEGAAIARLSHPHIIALHDVGPDYVAMAYIDGIDLARRMRAPIPVASALRYARQIASALAYAHRAGLIHRDVKPSNILIDKADNAYLADFGLARWLGDATLGESPRAGTPGYMAPEQRAGRPLGPACDQYALGRTLLAMLLGLGMPPSTEEALRLLPQGLSPELASVLRRATQLEVGARFPNAEAFGQALADIDAGNLAEAAAALLPVQRPLDRFAWATSAEGGLAVGADLERADYHLGKLEANGHLAADACRAFRVLSGYTEFGWSIYGRNTRLGALTQPQAFARAEQVTVLLHGLFEGRSSWEPVALGIARDHARCIVLVPDLHGCGESHFSPRLRPEQASPAGLLAAVRAWLSLLGISRLPTVLVGHSFSAVSVLTGRDDELGPRCYRVAITPTFLAVDPERRRQLKATENMSRLARLIPPLRPWLAKVMSKAPAIMTKTPLERDLYHQSFLRTPSRTVRALAKGLRTATLAKGDALGRCLVVTTPDDPIVPEDIIDKGLQYIGVPESKVYRLSAGGHYPHFDHESHPEWRARNVTEIVAIIDAAIDSTGREWTDRGDGHLRAGPTRTAGDPDDGAQEAAHPRG